MLHHLDLPHERAVLRQEEGEERGPDGRRPGLHPAPACPPEDDHGEEQAEDERERQAAEVEDRANVDVCEVQHLDGPRPPEARDR